jgi:hypothetical protein
MIGCYKMLVGGKGSSMCSCKQQYSKLFSRSYAPTHGESLVIFVLRSCRAHSYHFPNYHFSRQHVPPIDDTITPRHITTRTTRQIQKQALDLLNMALPTQRNHPEPLRNNLWPRPHFRIKEPGTNNIHPRKIPPLAR